MALPKEDLQRLIFALFSNNLGQLCELENLDARNCSSKQDYLKLLSDHCFEKGITMSHLKRAVFEQKVQNKQQTENKTENIISREENLLNIVDENPVIALENILRSLPADFAKYAKSLVEQIITERHQLTEYQIRNQTAKERNDLEADLARADDTIKHLRDKVSDYKSQLENFSNHDRRPCSTDRNWRRRSDSVESRYSELFYRRKARPPNNSRQSGKDSRDYRKRDHSSDSDDRSEQDHRKKFSCANYARGRTPVRYGISQKDLNFNSYRLTDGQLFCPRCADFAHEYEVCPFGKITDYRDIPHICPPSVRRRVQDDYDRHLEVLEKKHADRIRPPNTTMSGYYYVTPAENTGVNNIETVHSTIEPSFGPADYRVFGHAKGLSKSPSEVPHELSSASKIPPTILDKDSTCDTMFDLRMRLEKLENQIEQYNIILRQASTAGNELPPIDAVHLVKGAVSSKPDVSTPVCNIPAPLDQAYAAVNCDELTIYPKLGVSRCFTVPPECGDKVKLTVNPAVLRTGLTVKETIIDVQDSSVAIRLENPTDKRVRLKKNIVLAIISPCNATNIT